MKLILLLLILFILPLVTAIDLDGDITEEDEETFNEILTPIMKTIIFL